MELADQGFVKRMYVRVRGVHINSKYEEGVEEAEMVMQLSPDQNPAILRMRGKYFTTNVRGRRSKIRQVSKKSGHGSIDTSHDAS